MAKPTKTKTTAEVYTKGPDHAVTYANNARIWANAFDLTIEFGRVTRVEGATLYVETAAAVVMTLEHARATVGCLNRVLADFEQKYGAIRAVPRRKP